MAGISITLGGNFAALNTLQAKVAETAAKLRTGFAERIGHRMFDTLLAASASVAREIPAAIKKSIDAASDLSETVSKSTAIFGENADAIMSWSRNTAEAIGLSQQKALAAAADFGGLFSVMGVGSAEAGAMSKTLVELAADLASFNNTSVPDAIAAIGSALRGETEPLSRFQVLMNDATLKAAAMAKGLYDGTGALDPATKALAAYEVILTQTALAQGDFARTADGLAGSQKIIGAKFEDLTAQVGEHFLPAAEDFANWLKSLDVSSVTSDIGLMVEAMGQLAAIMSKMNELSMMFVPDSTLAIAKGVLQTNRTVDKKKATGPTADETDRAAAQVAAQARVVAETEKAKAAAEATKANAAFRKQLEEIQAGMLSVLAAEQARMKAVSAHEAELALIDAKTAGDAKRVELLEREAGILAKIGELTAAGVDGKEARQRAEALATANQELRIAERRREQEEMIAEAKKAAGFGDPGSETIEDLMSKLTSAKSESDSLGYTSSLSAVDSMQRIGGGGGFAAAGGLDYARQQTDLQRQMVSALRSIEERAKNPIE